jgi:hypothetical protein
MKDKLKDFINDNRAEFDNREPSDRVWEGISRNMQKGRGISIWTSVAVWRTAAVLFFGLSLYLMVSDRAVEKKEVTRLQGEFRDLESFYGDQIAEKVALIDKFEDAYQDDRFSQDIQKLDAMYEVLREEMKASPSSKVKDALILNMLIRIDLLNQQIQKLEDDKKSETTESI